MRKKRERKRVRVFEIDTAYSIPTVTLNVLKSDMNVERMFTTRRRR